MLSLKSIVPLENIIFQESSFHGTCTVPLYSTNPSHILNNMKLGQISLFSITLNRTMSLPFIRAPNFTISPIFKNYWHWKRSFASFILRVSNWFLYPLYRNIFDMVTIGLKIFISNEEKNSNIIHLTVKILQKLMSNKKTRLRHQKRVLKMIVYFFVLLKENV